MRLDVKVTLHNHVMKKARLELGWSQQRLAEECGWTHPQDIGRIEGMKMPTGKLPRIREKLYKIANALGMSFDELFPQEYLDAIQKKKLPRRKSPYQWCVEVPLEPFLDSWETNQMLITDGDELDNQLDREILAQKINELVSSLNDVECEVLQIRYGLNGYEPHTLEETALLLDRPITVTRERVRQIERKALEKLRHPIRSAKLKALL